MSGSQRCTFALRFRIGLVSFQARKASDEIPPRRKGDSPRNAPQKLDKNTQKRPKTAAACRIPPLFANFAD